LLVQVDHVSGGIPSRDSAPLVAAGRSLTGPAIQVLFRGYVTAMRPGSPPKALRLGPLHLLH
jgi:hypothetical protein